MDDDIYWAMEDIFDQYANDEFDDEELFSALSPLILLAEAQGADENEIIEEMSRAAANANVHESAGRALGFI